MILSKALILKGLAGVTALTSAVTIGVVGSKNGWWGSHQLTPEEIKTGLGIPDGCNLGGTVNCTDVEVTTSNINKMKFDGVTTGNPSISGTAKLTVTKVTPTDPNFPFDYKFSFQGKDANATITLSDSKTITLKSNEATEFKIKGTSASNLTLEKAWTAKTLGEKVGLVCTESSSTDKSCTLKDGSINVKNADNDKITNARVKNPLNKKIKYQEDQDGYNQKIKFYLEENEDITLTNATNDAGSADSVEKKICKKGNSGGSEVYYEIKKDSDSKWYLTKKTNG